MEERQQRHWKEAVKCGASSENRKKLLNPPARVGGEGGSIWGLHRITGDVGRGRKALCHIKNNKI